MVRQERAARTRAALVRAAAEEIDRSGYDGTSLNRVVNAAGISMGALTFHFSTKGELADEVQSQGSRAARTVADHATAGSGPALHAVIDLTLGLARLLEEDPVVRSAARLARERPDSPAWSSAWLPAVHSLLAQAQRDGQLHPAALPETIAALVVHLVAGTETYVRARPAVAETARVSTVVQLGKIWQLALTGISPHEPPDEPPAPHSRS
ncbi:TetR family transcriptional regulator [Streptomyces decoyicus]|uniref:TetR family transcriptional regulator n=1 Tax=Streptomyces decoyicus TaxID=249567 RepID=UPI003803F5DD